jgi:hypothetical protein
LGISEFCTKVRHGPLILAALLDADATVVGIEVKSAETVRGEDFRGLRHLASRLGDRFRTGIVLYAAIPMAALRTLDGSVARSPSL